MAGGAGSTGGDTSAGGSTASTGSTGGTAGQGGIGGEAGQGGVGGCVADPYVCDSLDCGLVANACGFYTNCDADLGPNGVPTTCKSQNTPAGDDGPMTCNQTTHRCECLPGGPEAQEMCGGANTLPSVKDWCISRGGCVASYCGTPPVPMAPEHCNGSGQFLANSTFVWCCAKPCAAATDCDDQNECTTNACGADGLCAFPNGPQAPCNGGAGICVDGTCINL
jgi:hypothetical protein